MDKSIPLIPYSSIYLDTNFGMMYKTMTQLVSPADRQLMEVLLSGIFLKSAGAQGRPNSIEERMLLTASVRTAFDLIL